MNNMIKPLIQKAITKLLNLGYTITGEEMVLLNRFNDSFVNLSKISEYNNDKNFIEVKNKYEFKEDLIKTCVRYIQAYLQEELGLSKVKFFLSTEIKSYYFSNFNNLQNSRLFIFIPDNNKKFGLLNESIILYHGLKCGSCIRLVETALSENYFITILHPNKLQYKNKKNPFNFHEQIEHYFKNVIKIDYINELVIYTSGYGGLSLTKLIESDIYDKSMQKKTKKIVICNSLHGETIEMLNQQGREFWEKTVVNYISSVNPRGFLEKSSKEFEG